MEHTANILNPKQGLITSLLRLFFMFGLRLSDDKNKLEDVAIRCINCKKETSLYITTFTLKEIISKFVLHSILYHVGMSWIIFSKEELKYIIDGIYHPYWLNKGTWCNTSICSRLHGIMFEDFITHARTNRYNLMCSLVAHDKK